MTKDEVAKVDELQKAGLGYKKISALMGISVNAVKSYCRRHPVELYSMCPQCGAPVEQTPHKRTKKFCSDTCRAAWWRDHPERIHRKTYHLNCAQCGKLFDSVGSSKRLYCSRACYADARRKAVSA